MQEFYKLVTCLLLMYSTDCFTMDILSSLPTPTCSSSFRAKAKDFTLNTGRIDSEKIITVGLDSKGPGKFGGESWKLKKHGRVWTSQAGVSVFAPAGDPRWFIEVFGPKAAAYFGFKTEGDDFVFVPDAHELNEALTRINYKLSSNDQIPIRFYEAKGKYVEANLYLKKFVDQHQLPLMSDIRARTHDLSYHVSALIFSKEVFDNWKQYLNEFDLFFDALTIEFELQNKKMPVEHQEALTKSWHVIVENKHLNAAFQIDRLSGSLALTDIQTSLDPQENENIEIAQALAFNAIFTSNMIRTMPPKHRESMTQFFPFEIAMDSPAINIFMSINSILNPKLMLKKLSISDEKSNQLPNQEEIIAAANVLNSAFQTHAENSFFTDFFKSYFTQRSIENPFLLKSIGPKSENFCAKLRERVELIRKIAEQLRQEELDFTP